jgi:hypothetical protein
MEVKMRQEDNSNALTSAALCRGKVGVREGWGIRV